MTDDPTPIAEALDQAVQAPGPVELTAAGPDGIPAHIAVDVDEVGPIGVRIRRLRVQSPPGASLGDRAERLASRLRPDGERMVPVEVDPVLGGGVLRTARDEVDGGYFEATLDPEGATELTRVAVDPATGDRAAAPFTVTRGQLRRLAEDLHGATTAAPD